MGLFSSILEKLGLNKPEAAKPTTVAAPKPSTQKPLSHLTPTKPLASVKPLKPQTASNAPQAASAPIIGKPLIVPMSEVNVVAKLDKMVKANPQKLDWKVSIVDLLKLLDLDSSLEARKELAKELGCPADKIGGNYADMNVWLHKTVLQKIAANGGNIPQNLL